jgi:fatty acid omega-hydroxy dehydrogenase
LCIVSLLFSGSAFAQVFDYIVIGGGPTGAALAAKLATGGKQVLLLERGKRMEEIPETMTLSGWPAVLNTEAVEQIPQTSKGKQSSIALAPNVLGGGSSLNAGVTEPEVDDSPFWEEHPFLDKGLVQEAYDEVSDKVAHDRILDEMEFPFAAAEAMRALSAANGSLEGSSSCPEIHVMHPKSVFDIQGRRHSAQGLLEPKPDNLTILTEASVQKVNFTFAKGKPPRASSVIYVDPTTKKLVKAKLSDRKGEIFLSAGAIHSPVLLMKSGIGPRKQLRSMDIPTVLENEHVGAHLMDQPVLPVAVPGGENLPQSAVHTLGFAEDFHIETVNGGTIATEMLPRTLAIFPAEQRTEQLSDRIKSFLDHTPGTLKNSINEALTFVLIPNNTSSEGKVSMTETGTPKIKYTPFANEDEVRTMYLGLKAISGLIASNEMEEFRLQDKDGFYSKFKAYFINKVAEKLSGRALGINEIATFPMMPPSLACIRSSSEQLGDFSENECLQDHREYKQFKKWLQSMHVSGWHFTSTNRVGEVLDRQFRVKNVTGLRVVDASSLRRPPRINPQLTLMMLGNYVGNQVLHGK